MAKISNKAKHRVSQAILLTVIFLLIVMLIYPLMMALWNSFKSDIEYERSKWYPTFPLRYKNLISGFNATYGYILNTLFVAFCGILGMLLISSMAAFAFTKIRFPGKMILFYVVIALMMVPSVMTLIPAYLLYRSIGLYDNLWSLILPMWTSACVNAVFLLVIFTAGLPNELFEAAQLDGAGVFFAFIKIALPLAMPILGTLAIMQIVSVWNDYMWPCIILTEERFTISAGLLITFTSDYTANMPVMFASYLISSTPLLLLFIFANKFYIQGLTSAGIKL